MTALSLSASSGRRGLSVNIDFSDHGGNFDSQQLLLPQAHWDSVTGEGMARGGAQQLALLKEMEANSTTLCQEVTKLTTALQEYQDMMQVRCLFILNGNDFPPSSPSS